MFDTKDVSERVSSTPSEPIRIALIEMNFLHENSKLSFAKLRELLGDALLQERSEGDCSEVGPNVRRCSEYSELAAVLPWPCGIGLFHDFYCYRWHVMLGVIKQPVVVSDFFGLREIWDNPGDCKHPLSEVVYRPSG